MSTLHSPSLTEQQQLWDWHWQHWQERATINKWKDRRNETILNFVRSLALDRPTILDLGCGPGWYTEKLAHFGHVTGIDLSEEAIAMAKARFPHITFLAGNLYEIPLPAEYFDIVVSQEVADHVEDPVAFLERAAYTLKSGGYLLLSCANRFVLDRLGSHEFLPQPAAHIGKYMDMKGWKHLLHSHFQILRATTIIPIGNRGILRLVNSHKLNAVLEFLIHRQYLEALKERAGLGYTMILLAQKKILTTIPSKPCTISDRVCH